jgi:hypothetical protein
MREIWKDIADWPLHQVSNMGRVRALPGARIKSRIATKIELRKQMYHSSGHLWVKGRPYYYVHRLVLQAFVGSPPHGMECRHLNGKPTDNRLSNLRWGTKAENAADRARHGTNTLGERNGVAKLTYKDVIAIRSLPKNKWLQRDIAKQYGVAQETISHVLRGTTWKHIL